MNNNYFDDDWIATSNRLAVSQAYVNWNHIAFQSAVAILQAWSANFGMSAVYEFSFTDYMSLLTGIDHGEDIDEEEAYRRLRFLGVGEVVEFFKERESHAGDK